VKLKNQDIYILQYQNMKASTKHVFMLFMQHFWALWHVYEH